MLKLYDTMIMSRVLYCAIIWAGAAVVHVKKIHLVQKRALRLVVWAKKDSPSGPIFYKLNRLTIFDEYKLQASLFMHNSINGNLPHFLSTHFRANYQIHNHKTRFSHNIHTYITRTNARKSTLMVSGPRIWNNIPNSIRNIKSSSLFRRTLKEYYLNMYRSN